MIDWAQVDTVLLDMDGTLLDLQFDNHFWSQRVPRAYADKHNMDLASAQCILRDRFAKDQGTLAWYCLDYWSEQLDIDIAALKHDVQHMVSARPFALEFLDYLRRGGQGVILVTNAHRKTLGIKLDQVDMAHCFDRIVVSHDLHAAKESAEFWPKLQALHPFDSSRTLLIDDTEAVLSAARNFGIAHLLTLLQPDSGAGKRIDTHFPGIHHFDEIMPLVERR